MSEKSSYAKLIHYPECWDTAAYPTLGDAIHEALSWSGCSVCGDAPKVKELEANKDILLEVYNRAEDMRQGVIGVEDAFCDSYMEKLRSAIDKASK